MRQLPLRSITVQLIILFVAFFAWFEIASLGYRYLNQTKALMSLEAVRIADRVAVLKSIAEQTPPEKRSTLSADSQGSGLYVFWTKDRLSHLALSQNEETNLLRNLLLRVLPKTKDDDVFVGLGTSKDAKIDPNKGLAARWKTGSPFPDPVSNVIDELAAEPTAYISIRMSDGTWLNFFAAYVATLEFWPINRIALLSLLLLGSVVLSIWAIQRLTSPFRLFASAATRLGTDVNAKPIEEHGPSEVRSAIQAFNEMQGRLKSFVEDRTQMLAAVSHDLRTPITRMRLRAECLRDRVQSKKLLEDLREMEDMIEGVLTFAKDDALSEPTISVDLMTMLQGICDELSDRGFNVSFEAQGRCPYQCRRVSMRRCFANLIENAVRYGGQTLVRIKAREPDISICIEDSGPGIPEEHQEDVFRPFFRLERSRGRDSGGSGLGLTVARTVARAHGGDVTLSTVRGKGLTVTVTLPKNEAVPAPQSISAAAN